MDDIEQNGWYNYLISPNGFNSTTKLGINQHILVRKKNWLIWIFWKNPLKQHNHCKWRNSDPPGPFYLTVAAVSSHPSKSPICMTENYSVRSVKEAWGKRRLGCFQDKLWSEIGLNLQELTWGEHVFCANNINWGIIAKLTLGISQSNITWYCTQLNDNRERENKGETWIHKRHTTAHPDESAIVCQLWVPWKKWPLDIMSILYTFYPVDDNSWKLQGSPAKNKGNVIFSCRTQ